MFIESRVKRESGFPLCFIQYQLLRDKEDKRGQYKNYYFMHICTNIKNTSINWSPLFYWNNGNDTG